LDPRNHSESITRKYIDKEGSATYYPAEKTPAPSMNKRKKLSSWVLDFLEKIQKKKHEERVSKPFILPFFLQQAIRFSDCVYFPVNYLIF
jgi:hypothetical protein